jgi:uncharacterized glyoxalase superfamily protein PhnB
VNDLLGTHPEEIHMKPTPPGWPRISSALYYEDPRKAIEWLCEAFGFELRLLVEGDGGRVEHSELTYGDGVIMVASPREKSAEMPYARTPAQAGGNTQSMMIYVDDVEAHCTRARAAGAVITKEPATSDYGDAYWVDRGYACRDLGGHHWWIAQRIATGGKPSA